MTSLRALAPIAAAAIAASWVTAAHAQFGYYQLPKNDFVWNWGNAERTGAKFEDFCKRCRECISACPIDLFREVDTLVRPEGVVEG